MRKAPKAVTTAATSGEAPTGGVKVFTHHGVELHQNQGSDQAMGTCPFCGKENKFYVSVKTTKWKCMSCDEHGNATTFLRNLWEYAREVDTDCSSFLEDRRLLFPETVDAWGVCLSPLTEEWLIPGFTFDKKLNQLYRFVQDPKTGRYRAWATPLPFKHQLHIPDDYDAGKPDVYLCEGFSDGMALWEVLRRAKAVKGEDTLAVTSTESVSFLSKANVLAAPGANVFSDQWAPFFASKRVFLLYDNDHPNKQARTDKPLAPVGYAGMRRVANILSKCETPPKEVHFLRWSEKEGEEHNPDLPSGYDVRDYLTREEEAHNVVALHRGNGMVRTAEVRLRERVHNLQGLLAKLKPIPEDWIDGRGKKATSSGGLELECLPCADWQSLVNSWRKALKWTDGLDVALSVMLAAITSTKAVGDQLWCKVISPPSCLHGDTPIHDPVDGSTKTVKQRWEESRMFSVYTLRGEQVGVAQALPPVRHEVAQMYEVKFASGRSIKVTGGHRVWDGSSYVSVSQLAKRLDESFPCLLPSISDTDLSTRLQGARRSFGKAQGCPSGCRACFCSCGERLPSGQDTYQRVLPSRGDALGRTRCNFGGGDLDVSSTHTLRQFARLSRRNGLLPFSSSRCAVGFSPSAASDTSEPLPSLCSSGENTLERTDHCGRVLPVRQFSSSSKLSCGDRLPVGLSSKCSQTTENTRSGVHTSFETSQSCTSSATPRSVREIEVSVGSLVLLDVYPVTLDTLTLTDEVVSVQACGESEYYDFHVPETRNYWAEGVFHHNSGKSVLCEALTVNKRYVIAKSTIRGFHSGYQVDKEGTEDNSLLSKLNGKTLVTKDGDTLLQAPNLGQILSEARDIYDRNSRTHYRNKMSKDYEGFSMTWLLCGTESLRCLDSSELGERFLDVVIVDEMPAEEEREIGHRVRNTALREIALESNGRADSKDRPEIVKSKQLTGGYIDYLRLNASALLPVVAKATSDDMLDRCQDLAEFVSFMRSRPSTRQDEKVQRELSFRLISQMVRLAVCLGVVLGKKEVDEEVMRRVKKVALDTARGRTMRIAQCLYQSGDRGVDPTALSQFTHESREKLNQLLRFLVRIGAAESFRVPTKKGMSARVRWRLTPRVDDLYGRATGEERGDSL